MVTNCDGEEQFSTYVRNYGCRGRTIKWTFEKNRKRILADEFHGKIPIPLFIQK
jgi:hypothetical protein